MKNSSGEKIPVALRRFFPPGKHGGITHEDMLAMTDHERAVFAACAPRGFVPVQNEDGTIAFYAQWAIDKMHPSERQRLNIVRMAQ